MISPVSTLALPRFSFFFFCAWIFYLCYSLGTLQSNKPPSFSPVLDLEPKLETAWLEQRGGSQERGRCGHWTEQIAPLQSAFYPKTPSLKYPNPSPSNHGSACFPLINYLVAHWCFLPYLVTFKRGRNLKRWMLNWLKLNFTVTEPPHTPLFVSFPFSNWTCWTETENKKWKNVPAQLDDLTTPRVPLLSWATKVSKSPNCLTGVDCIQLGVMY